MSKLIRQKRLQRRLRKGRQEDIPIAPEEYTNFVWAPATTNFVEMTSLNGELARMSISNDGTIDVTGNITAGAEVFFNWLVDAGMNITRRPPGPRELTVV